jgi:hypothetical protein
MELLLQEVQGQDDRGQLVFIAGRTTVYRSAEQVDQRSLA